jgi:hypothetical protein
MFKSFDSYYDLIERLNLARALLVELHRPKHLRMFQANFAALVQQVYNARTLIINSYDKQAPSDFGEFIKGVVHNKSTCFDPLLAYFQTLRDAYVHPTGQIKEYIVFATRTNVMFSSVDEISPNLHGRLAVHHDGAFLIAGDDSPNYSEIPIMPLGYEQTVFIELKKAPKTHFELELKEPLDLLFLCNLVLSFYESLVYAIHTSNFSIADLRNHYKNKEIHPYMVFFGIIK